jgi:ribosomal-protein-serine acetyltransferase
MNSTLTLNCAPGLRLRLPDRNDVPEFFQLIKENNAHLSAWHTWTAEMISLNRVHQWIERNHHAYEELIQGNYTSATHPGFSFLMEVEGKIAGIAGFQGINCKNDVGALGYWIGSAYAGKGYTTAAMRQVILFAFEVLALNRLEIQMLTTNEPSRKVAEKLGFKQEAVLAQIEKKGNAYFDHYLYRLLRSEWQLL